MVVVMEGEAMEVLDSPLPTHAILFVKKHFNEVLVVTEIMCGESF